MALSSYVLILKDYNILHGPVRKRGDGLCIIYRANIDLSREDIRLMKKILKIEKRALRHFISPSLRHNLSQNYSNAGASGGIPEENLALTVGYHSEFCSSCNTKGWDYTIADRKECRIHRLPSTQLSPRISFSREIAEEEVNKTTTGVKPPSPSKIPADLPEESDLDPEVSGNDLCNFEFRLEDPVTMLPADELFSDGKLVPLQLSMLRSAVASSEIRSLDTPISSRRIEISATDPYLFSPKAPRCSSR
ncbi:hypothetical protein LguiA_012528 [Lonicera macranthoides]